MLKPRALKPGDRLAVVAPASAFQRDEFDAGVQGLRDLGFVPVFDESIFERKRYLAGSADVRAGAIVRAWRDPSIAGLITVRGGFGSAQVLPLLDPQEARRASKPLIGYSDITSLLTFLTVHCGLVAFHGPMLEGRIARGPEGYDRDTFMRAVCRAEPMGEVAPESLESLTTGEASGPLFGGTMTQLLTSLGTPWAFAPPQGCVLFLEDVGERPYRIDRMVTQLQQSGILARARAIVLGEMRGCDEPSGSPTARDVLSDLFRDFPGPVVIGFPSGHTTGPTMTLPLGVQCRVVAGRHSRLVIEESAVS